MSDSILTRRRFLAGGAAGALAAGLALAGCAAGDGSSSSAGSASASGSDASAGSKSSSSAGSEAQPREFLGAFSYVSDNVNPIGNSSALAIAASWHVFEGLYDMDLHTFKPYNALAVGGPVQLSQTEYQVTLRESAKFSNGVAVTSDDVANAFQRNMQDPTYGNFLSFIDQVSIVDAKTVEFKLKYPLPDLFRERLSLVKIFPKSLSDEELARMPIGTGPWMYEEIDAVDGGHITFSPNPHYNGAFVPKVDSMTWSIVLDGAERARTLLEGNVQVMENVPEAQVKALREKDITVAYEQGFGQAFLMFNCLKPPFNDRRVRQAFFHAIDVDKLIDEVMIGHASPLTSFLPENHKNYHVASHVYDYNPDTARTLLDEAGVGNFTFTMLTNNNWVKDLAPHIQSDLAAVGITMINDERKVDWTALAPGGDGTVLPFDVMLSPGDPSCFGNDPDLLMSWWYGDNVWTMGRSCWAKTGDGRFEEMQVLLQRARESEGKAQQQIWNDCFNLISEEVPLYGLFHREIATAYRQDELTGFAPLSTTGLSFLGVMPAK